MHTLSLLLLGTRIAHYKYANDSVKHCLRGDRSNPAVQELLRVRLWPHSSEHRSSSKRDILLHLATDKTVADLEKLLVNHYDYHASHGAFLDIVSSLMIGKSMHSFVHILRPLLELACKYRDGDCVYAEIGSAMGATMSLALSFPGITHAIAVSPAAWYAPAWSFPQQNQGSFAFHECLRTNIDCLNIYNANVTYIQDLSIRAVPRFKQALDSRTIDVLLIDGCHSTSCVLDDFKMYMGFVRPGGVIIFDDWLDKKYSPGVAVALNAIRKQSGVCTETFQCVDALPNAAGATSTCGVEKETLDDSTSQALCASLVNDNKLNNSNEFIMVRKQ
jgi:hypothetical protein